MIIEYTIELSWSHRSHSGEIELDNDYFASMAEDERETAIEQMVDEAVANEVSWGWQVKE